LKKSLGVAICLLVFAFLVTTVDAQEQITLEAVSEEGTFLVEVLWTPADLERDHTFSITFIEPETDTELEDMQYNLVVLQGEDQKLRRVDQVATEQKIRFEVVGPHTIVIEDIEGLGEDASFAIQVTPEFPLGAVIPVAVATMVAIFAVRSKSLFRHWKK
jgi:hypothetical protein